MWNINAKKTKKNSKEQVVCKHNYSSILNTSVFPCFISLNPRSHPLLSLLCLSVWSSIFLLYLTVTFLFFSFLLLLLVPSLLCSATFWLFFLMHVVCAHSDTKQATFLWQDTNVIFNYLMMIVNFYHTVKKRQCISDKS